MTNLDSQSNYDEYILSEIKDLVNELNNFLRRNKNENNEIKFTIQLSQRLKSIQSQTRELILQSDLDPKDKLEVLSDILPRIMESLNIFPKQFRSKEIFLDLSILSNFLLLNLTSTGRNYDKWRMQASANILSKLLVSTPRLDELPPIDMDDIKGIQRTRNALIMTSGVYLETIITLYDVNFNNFVEWASSAFFHFNQYDKFLDQINLPMLLKKGDAQQYFMLTRFFLLPIWNALVFILNLKKTFGDDWPEEIDLQGFVSASSAVDELHSKINDKFTRNFTRIQEEYTNGRFSKNDNPKDSDHLQRLSIIKEYSKLYKMHEKLMENAIEGDETALEKLITQVNVLQDKIGSAKSDHPPLKSNYKDYYTDLYNLMLDYYALDKTNADRFSSMVQEIRENREVFTDLFYKLFKVNIYRRRYGFDNLSTFGDDLDLLKSKMEYKLREFLDLHILELLVHQNEIKITDSSLDKIRSISIDMGRNDLHQKLMKYIQHLEDPEFDPPELPEINVFDHHTWLYPETFQEYKYYPISLFSNKIVR